MKIKNETHWRTDDLKKILRAAILAEGMDPNERWSIRIYYGRRTNDTSGYAYYHSRTFRIGLPKRIWRHEKDGTTFWNYDFVDEVSKKTWTRYAATEDDIPEHAIARRESDRYVGAFHDVDELPKRIVEEAARTIIHEIGHCQGLRHEDMVCSSSIEVPWADGLKIRKKTAAKPKPKPDREAKAIAAVERLEDLLAEEEKRHRARTKSLKTRLSKAKRSMNYYEKKRVSD